MKKFLLGIFSVFMMLTGGMLTACCEKQVSLSIDTENVTIYTNSQNQYNVLSKEVTVYVGNSSAGIGKMVEPGGDNTIHLSATRRRNDNTYSFTIYGDKSGTARVRVWAIDNVNLFKVIYVNVNTVLEKIDTTQNDSTQGRTNRFIVKGDGNEKLLNAEDYFDLKPLTANIKDIEWTFTNGQADENGTPVMIEDSRIVAKIENNKLWVSQDAQMEKVNLKASFTENKDIANTVEFDVLDNSTINSLQISDNSNTVSFYADNAIQTETATFELKRNDATNAVASGEIVINTKYDIRLSPIFYEYSTTGLRRIDNYLDYFTFDVTSREENTGRVTYHFEINAQDYYDNNTSGEYLFQLSIGYADYDYDIVTNQISPIIQTSYAVDGIELLDAQQNPLNNKEIDIFSQYNSSGYTIRTILLPNDGVQLDNNLFNIKININQSSQLRNYFAQLSADERQISSLVRFMVRGRDIEFTNSNYEFTSAPLQSGDTITLIASDKIKGSLEGVVFDFVPQSDDSKKTQITLNLYRISAEQSLDVYNEDGADLETQYVASTIQNAQISYNVKIMGLTSAAGLSFKHDNNPRFIFPEEDYFVNNPEAVVEKHVAEGEDDQDFIIVSFTVRLSGTNFDSTASFWFEHITQVSSKHFDVEAFIPINDVSILNADPLSSNVYYSKNLEQGFLLDGSSLIIDPNQNLTNVSLAKIMIEAGSVLSLETTFQSLSTAVEYGFVTLDSVKEIAGEETGENIFKYAGESDQLFEGKSALNYLSTLYGALEGIWSGLSDYFSITTNRLTLSNNAFKGFVFARFNGFSIDHREVVAVRIFALESFYAVKTLSSNVRDKILYTTETLSQADIARASVDVTISFRTDGKTPTYTNDISYFTLTSSLGDWEKDTPDAVKKNRYYTISNISTPVSGRFFSFTITATSTAHQTSVHDLLTITYQDDFGFMRKVDISLEIRNVNRVEKVEWVNRTSTGDVYLNLTSPQESARKFVIKTAVSPNGLDGANDKTLGVRPATISGDGSRFKIAATENIDGGQNFNLSITGDDNNKGGVVNLYILPNDMIKRVDGIDQVLIYKYEFDDDGNLLEENICYIPLNRLENYYDQIINGSDEYSNFFLNNDNERIYYSDVILCIPIIIADGENIETAVRIYSEDDLKKIDKALKYRIMNNLTLSGWQTFDRIAKNGAVFGDNDSVTLNFTSGSQNFVDSLEGQIFDLIFTGEVTTEESTAGFVANTNLGTISNVRIDVSYKNNKYSSSSLTNLKEEVCVGGIVGDNQGTIINSYTYGMDINAPNSLYAGGIAGKNSGRIESCGVEFYTFGENDYNTFTLGRDCNFGGLVGQVTSADSRIYRSYIYAYPFTDVKGLYNTLILGATNVYMFVGNSDISYNIEECFGFMSNLQNVSYGNVRCINSYYLRFAEDNTKMTMTFLTDGINETNNQTYQEGNLQGVYRQVLDGNIWQLDDIDINVNFGMIYLKNNVQSAALNINDVKFNENTDKIVKVDDTNAVLFYYQPTATITDSAERMELVRLNTLELTDLFNIEKAEQKSLIISSVSQNLSITSTSLRITNTESRVVNIVAHSKMDLTNTKTFNVVIVNNLPKLTTLIDGYVLNDNEVVTLQTSNSATDKKMLTLVHQLDHSIMLNGNEYSSVADNSYYQIDYVAENNIIDEKTGETYVSFTKSELSLVLSGNKASDSDLTSVSTYVEIKNLKNIVGLDATIKEGDKDVGIEKYNNALREKLTRQFKVSVYNGARRLLITNANKLNFSPVDYATFDVLMTTDSDTDNLVFTLNIGDRTFQSDHISTLRNVEFEIDTNLHLQVIWNLNEDGTKYSVSVYVPYAERYKVVKEYNFTLSVNALSQIDNTMYVNTVEMKLVPEYVNAVDIDIYDIQTRRSVNNTMYYTQSDNKATTIIPSSDAILVVHVTPEFALATHFTLTYAIQEGTNQPNAAIQIMRLVENPNFGLYLNNAKTSTLDNGMRVNIDDDDRSGDGYYYFRVYASNIFQDSTTIIFTATFYSEGRQPYVATQKLNIDFMQDAQITINDQRVSSYLIAKGTTANIKVTVGIEQTATISLQNNGYGISLIQGTPTEEGNFRIYTAILDVKVNAKVMEEGRSADTGVFYVRAGVSRLINGVPDIKYTSITMNLLDFIIDSEGISVSGSHNTTQYNQNTYDAFYVYRGAPTRLTFDYPLIPQNYNINQSNPDEVDAVKHIETEKGKFINNNNYENEKTQYYINYTYDLNSNSYSPLALKQQLAYARDEYDTESIYNSVTGGINRNDLFSIEEEPGTTNLVFTGINTGKQLMRLETIVYHKGQLIARIPYFFVVVVDSWYDEENPVAITSQADLERYADPNRADAKAEDYILMNDIVLENYTPLSTTMFNSLDGNGYTIHLNSFAMPENSRSLRLALFDEVTENTTLKNVRVNIYQGGQIKANIARNTGYSTVNIAGFALTNNGIIYNCEVVAFKSDYQTVNVDNPGLNVIYTNGNNDTEVQLTDGMNIDESVVAGFVIDNNLSIVNSRVGGESVQQVINIAGTDYLSTLPLENFIIKGQVRVAGFVANNYATISASFADNVDIYNMMNSNTTETAGFVLYNNGNVEESYVEGAGGGRDEENNSVIIPHRLTKINVFGGYVAGFVFDNSGEVKNSYANIAIENSTYKASYVAGFVYRNNEDGIVTLCFTACEIENIDSQQRPFAGVSGDLSLNNGSITYSYYYSLTNEGVTNEANFTSGVTPIADLVNNPENLMYGFSFASGENSGDGIWVKTDDGITLVNANKIAVSNRYMFVANETEQFIYNTALRDNSTLLPIDLSYGSERNPIIIRSAKDFVLAMGKAQSNEISSYAQYYSSTAIWGNYRFVNDIEFDETIEQNPQSSEQVEGRYNLTTSTKTFEGSLIGNGFTLSGIRLSSLQQAENYGLFAKLDTAKIINLQLGVEYVNTDASIVGILAGTAVDTKIISVAVEGENTTDGIKVNGENIVGGLVGMLFGESRLQDISISNIYVVSADYESKTITRNTEYTSRLKGLIQERRPLIDQTTHLSYAGAVVGYVDMYKNTNDTNVKFETTIFVDNFDILNVHVSGFVNVYGEVAGGLFGYVGRSTKIYDASLTLDADASRSIHPSYIIAKNLYAGGLIGENYGGLFAVYASYSQDIQDAIEEGENSYYMNGASVERGQDSIFSYDENADREFEDVDTKYDDPLFIGGLVGYMGAGYIYIGYSKLNVVARSARTLAVGGIIGMLSSTGTTSRVDAIEGTPNANIVLNDVYASGDVHLENGRSDAYSAGIVGALSNASSTMPVLVMRDVMAMNYYKAENSRLVGDNVLANAETSENLRATSDHHFMLIGALYQYRDNSFTRTNRLNSNLYIIKDNSAYYNVYDATYSASNNAGHITVGGYNKVVIGQNSVYINPFGFGFDVREGDKIQDYLIYAVHIGESIMQSEGQGDLSTPSTYFKGYFIERGWQEQYWVHENNKLFPRIELSQRANEITWDVYNTEEVVSAMETSHNIKIVLRGKTSRNELSASYTDIDLRLNATQNGMQITQDLYNRLHNAFKQYTGTLVSYYQDRRLEDCRLNESVTENGTVIGGKAPSSGVPSTVDPGLIIDAPLFGIRSGADTGTGMTVNGINFYFTPNAESSTGAIDYTLVGGESEGSGEKLINSIFRNVSLIYNKSVALSTSGDTVGLITDKPVDTCTFIDTKIVVRGEDSTISLTSTNTDTANIGLIAGKISLDIMAQEPISVSGIQLEKELENNNQNDEEKKVVKISISSSAKITNVGLLSGVIERSGEALTQNSLSEINVGLNEIKGVEMTVTAGNSLYIGGFVGQMNNVNNVMYNQTESTGETKGFSMIINSNVQTLYAGGAFGQVIQGSLEIAGSAASNAVFTSGIYLGGTGSISGNVNIGGLIGYTNANVSITNFSVRFGLGKLQGVGEAASVPTYKAKVSETDDTEYDTFDKFYFDHSEVLSPFTISGGQIGGMIGNVDGGNVTIAGGCAVSGTVDVATVIKDREGTVVDIGGYIGSAQGNIETNISATNSLNISVYEDEQGSTLGSATANIGGIVGQFSQGENASQDENAPLNTISINNSISEYVNYTGVVLAAVKSINFGGAVGYMNKTNFNFTTSKNFFNHVAFGGSLEVWDKVSSRGNTINGCAVRVGGVIGAYDHKTPSGDEQDEITNARTYGDVFVNYSMFNKDGYSVNNKFTTYYFGGIVGYATNVHISNCSTIMTSFNNRLATNVIGVNAIVGGKSGKVTYGGNKYSSGVMMAYQVEDGNTDCYYGAQEDNNYTYSGYTNKAIKPSDSNAPPETTNENILEDFSSFGGNKLNPIVLSADSKFTTNISANQVEFDKIFNDTILGTYHNITWFYLNSDLGKEENPISSLGDNITNMVIVGNGHTVTVSDTRISDMEKYDDDRYKNQYKGALIDSMGAFYDSNRSEEDNPVTNADGVEFIALIPNFTAITGMIINLQVESADIDGENLSPSYGGVIGVTNGNSFIYGVGVTGQLSVGGNSRLQLGGIVGTMKHGMIDECFVDADISYRAAPNYGYLSGVANVGEYNTTIKNTYSSGMLETFVNTNIFTLAYSPKVPSALSSNDIRDVYSISQIKVTDLLSGSSGTPSINFINTINNEGEEKFAFNTFGQYLNGTAEVGDNGTEDKKDDYTPVEEMALAYSEAEKSAQSYSIKAAPEYDGDEVANGDITQTPWYFSPYVNYGYASHGFGYLKNVTTYTEKDGVYTQVSYAEIYSAGTENYGTNNDGEWYLGVPNVGKFEQMVSTVGTSDNYTKDYKFLLKYNLDMSNYNGTYGDNILKTDYKFILDGDGHTLDFASAEPLTTPLFGEVKGDIKNLRLADITTSGAATLASTVNGSISNIVAIGSVTSGANVVGGVVATLNGSADKIQSLVNITKTNGGIVGGIVGVLNKLENDTYLKETNGTITYSSNSGQIVSTGNTSGGIIDPTTSSNPPTFLYFAEITTAGTQNSNSTKELGNIAGGIVGYANGGTVENSYNANAVLSGFTDTDGDKSTNKYLAGGIVGYASGTIINSSYNTGLVGAGNYGSTDTYAIAGGIFGYGSPNLTGCINDGAVQAINQVDETKFVVEFSYEGGSDESTGFKKSDELSNLKYRVTMIYNADVNKGGSDRMVYAFGLGYANGGSINNSQSSIDNIKNDGNIGCIRDVQEMEFTRQSWMDDPNGEYLASFTVDSTSNYKINGYDNYGFPARIYLEDKMTRKLNDTNTKAFYNKVKVGNMSINRPRFPFFSATSTLTMSKSIYKGTVKNSFSSGSNNDFAADENAAVNSKEYNFSADTTFYACTEFDEYDNIVRNQINLIKYSTSDTYNPEVNFDFNFHEKENNVESNEEGGEEDNTASDINELMQEIDKYGESTTKKIRTMSINGQLVAIVENSQNMQAVYIAAYADFSVKFTVSDVLKNSVSKENFIVSVTGHKDDVSIIKNLKFENGENGETTYTLSGTIYFNKNPGSNCEVKVSFKYNTEPVTISLRHNTVKQDGNNLRIDLSGYMASLTNNGFDKDSIEQVSLKRKDGTELMGDRSYSWDGDYLVIQNLNLGDEKDLDLTLQFTVINIIKSDMSVETLQIDSVSGTTESVQLSTPTPTYPTLTFEEKYEEFDNEFLNSNVTKEKVKDEENETLVGLSYDLSALTEQANGKLAFGNDEYAFKYENGAWTVFTQKEDDGLEMNFEGNKLVITGSAENLTAFDNSFEAFNGIRGGSDNIKPNEYGGVGSPDEVPNSVDTEYSIKLGELGEIVERVSLSGDKDWNAALLDYKTFQEKLANFKGEKEEFEKYGLKFYTVKAKFSYDVTDITLKFDESCLYKGYTLTIGDNFIKQGSVIPEQKTLSIADREKAKEFDGQSISLTVNTVNYPSSQAPFAFRSSTLSLKQANGDDNNTQYNVFKTVYDGTIIESEAGDTKKTCPICGEVCESISTTKTTTENSSSGPKRIYYTYTIFKCGAIRVEYGTTENQSTKMIQYTYYNQEAKGFTAGTITEMETTLSVNDDNITSSSSEEKSIDDVKNFSKYFYGNSDITVDFIVSDFGNITESTDSDKYYDGYISVIKSPNNIGNYTFCGAVEDQYRQQDTPNCEVYFGYQDSEPITVHAGETLHWKESKEFNYQTTQDDYEFVAKNEYPYNSTEFTYYFDIEESTEPLNVAIQSTGGNSEDNEPDIMLAEEKPEPENKFEIVLLDADIYVSMGLTKNDKTLVGNSYILKFQETTLFNVNESIIKDINFVGQRSLENVNDNTSLLMPEISASVNNVKLYGNMRNVNATYDITVSSCNVEVEQNDNKDIYIGNIKSYVAMTGLDAGEGESVNVTLEEKSCPNAGGIIVAGSAMKAKNGSDGSGYITYDNNNIVGGSGIDGAPGGAGGSIKINTNNITLARVGAGGMSGYGGNGVNGWFNSNVALGGGAGGMTHKKGQNGLLNGTEDTSFKPNIASTQCGGNGGVGGLGRFYIKYIDDQGQTKIVGNQNGYVYFSGNGGQKGFAREDINETHHEAYPGDCGDRKLVVNDIYRLGLNPNRMFTASDFNTESGAWYYFHSPSNDEMNERYNAWIDGAIGNDSNYSKIYGGKGDDIGDNRQRVSETIYVSASIDISRLLVFLRWILDNYWYEYGATMGKVNVWCSGEVINGGGAFQGSEISSQTTES